MRIALFSDIHGNLTGLRAVLAALDSLGGADVVISAGDHILGESAADEVVELLLARGVRMLRGDSDTLDKLEALERKESESPGSTRSPAGYYRAMLEWLGRNLSPWARDALAALPLDTRVEAAPGRFLYACHATPRSPADRVCRPEVDAATARLAYAGADAEVVAFGHAHTPFTRLLDGRLHVNVASVGFRPSATSMLTLVTFAGDLWVCEQHAVPYDAAAERGRSEARGVPVSPT